MSEIEKKVDARLKKPFFTEMLTMAYVNGANHSDYLETVKKWAVFFREKLEERDLIKKIKHRPKEFWNFKGKKTIYNIDGGQLSLSITGAATMGVRVGVYKVKPGDYSKSREDYDDSSLLTSNLVDRTGESHFDEDEDFELDYKKMIESSRMIMEAAEIIKQVEGKGKWKDKPSEKDLIFLHGPILFEAAMYHMASDANEKFPPFKKEFCDKILQHGPNFILREFKDWRKEDDEYLRTFIPLYCEIANYLKSIKIPTYGVVERSVNKAPGAVSTAMIGELYQTKLRKYLMETRNFEFSWNTKRVSHASKGEEILKIFKSYVLGDPYLFDLILDEGEYIKPIQVLKQNPAKWPMKSGSTFFARFFNNMPEPFVTYIKTSEFRKPIRVECLNILDSYDDDIDFVFHSAKMLPQYAFPLGLDTVDKLAKVPNWMRHSLKNAYQMRMLRALINTGNKDYIELGLKSLIPNRNGFNRP